MCDVVAGPRGRRTKATIEHMSADALLLGSDRLVPQPLDSRHERLLSEIDLDDLLKHFVIRGAEPCFRVPEHETRAAGGFRETSAKQACPHGVRQRRAGRSDLRQ